MGIDEGHEAPIICGLNPNQYMRPAFQQEQPCWTSPTPAGLPYKHDRTRGAPPVHAAHVPRQGHSLPPAPCLQAPAMMSFNPKVQSQKHFCTGSLTAGPLERRHRQCGGRCGGTPAACHPARRGRACATSSVWRCCCAALLQQGLIHSAASTLGAQAPWGSDGLAAAHDLCGVCACVGRGSAVGNG